jgi:GTP-binding protein
MSRIVAIVGRPNVGKSAVFNRVVCRRVAIVHDQPGVTRDRIVAEARFEDQRFDLIDTGGLGRLDHKDTEDTIEVGTRDQAQVAIAEAQVIIFVVDITAGITPLDREVARLLHESGRKVFVAANKADHERLDAAAGEFEPLGFPVFPVAALHHRGFQPLLQAVVRELPDEEAPTRTNPLRVAIVGKPNAGKSSLINRILRSERVLVSPVPGTTRDSVEIPFTIGSGPQARHYQLIDTAGLRKLRRIDNAVERWSIMRAQESIEKADICVLVLDAEQGPTVQDKKIADLIVEHRKGCVVAVNKWDLAEGSGVTQRAYEKGLREAMPFFSYAPTVFISAKSGLNVRRAIETIDHVSAQITANLPTSVLNRVLHAATQRVQPPMVHGKRLKIYYGTQVGDRPLRIRLFVNDVNLLGHTYRAFLLGCLRESNGLEGAPVVFDLKSSHEHEEGERKAPALRRQRGRVRKT